MLKKIIIILFLFFVKLTFAQVLPSDSLSLVALYNSTNGPNWTHNDNWLQGPVNSWYGIMISNGRVTEINLTLNNLSGYIPSELGNLSNLQILNLGNGNQLTGSIPPELGNLNNLERLDLYGNQLTGSIPPELGNLNNLNWLNLAINQLTGSIPPELGNLSNLHVLDLYGNQLTGSIPPELGNLTNLQRLSLNSTQLSGSIPPELGNLTNLQSLTLHSNNLAGSIPPELGNLNNLVELHLSDNQLTGSIPPELGNLINLQDLNLYSNQLNGSIPSELGNLNNLLYLEIGNNNLSGSIPPELGNLSNLQVLGLESNQLTGFIPVELGNLGNLVALDLSSNQLTGSIPTILGNLLNLQFLDLSFNNLTGSIPSIFGNLTNLYGLYLSNNNLNGPIPSEIGNLYNLQYLYLFHNQLTGLLPPELGNLTNLLGLNVQGNKLTGEIPPELVNLSKLRALSLDGNQFIGDIPQELNNLSNLTTLFLKNNYFSNLPKLDNLTNLNRLWIQYNKFTFEDIEPNIGLANDFKYAPQDSVGIIKDTTAYLNEPFYLAIQVGGQHNQYQWKKDGNPIPGANNDTLSFSSISYSDSGVYTCEITNTVATQLTLYSRPITVHVERKIIAPLFAATDSIQGAGTQFWVDVQVGDAANPVTDLFGVSFSLHYTNTQYIDVVSPYGANVLAGSFMGTNVIFLPFIDDPNGQVDIGISRQAGQGGVSGYGPVARIQFAADVNTPHNTPVTFTIDNITANDPAGNPIQLDPQDVTITITSIIVWPGDANNDGTANVADVLPLGLYYNLTGPARPNASNTWTGQICPPGWNPQNAAYADCNGDGIINVADVLPIGLNYNQTHSKSQTLRKWLSFNEELPMPQVRYTVYDSEMRPTLLSAIGAGEDFYLGFSLDQAKDFAGVSFTLDWQGSPAEPGGMVIDRQFGQNGLQVSGDWQPYLLTLHQPLESQQRCEFGFSLKGGEQRYDGSELALLKCQRTGSGALALHITDLVALDWEGRYYQGIPMVGIGDSQELLVIGKDFNLQNYPNPFNPTTTIRFALPRSERVWLTVYNTLGQQVAQLVNGRQLTAGAHEYRFDASTLANGLYFYRLQVGQQVVIRKMLLMK